MGLYNIWAARGLETRYRSPELTRSRAAALNPAGDIFVLLLIVVGIVGAISHEPLIGAVGALALVVSIVSRVWAALSLEEITIDRSASANHAFQGDNIEITFIVENNKPLPVPWLEINEYVPRGLLIEGFKKVEQSYLGGAEIKATTSLGAYERVRLTRTLTAISRGRYRLGKTKLRSGDLFGLYPSDGTLEHTPWAIFVYPKIKAIPGFTLPARRPIGDALSRDRLWNDPSRPAGVREYRPGDPIKNIDWKTTAKRNEMFVRQFDPSVSEHAVLFVEALTTSVPWEGYRSDVLEGTMVAAASIANHALDLGYKVGLVTDGVISSGASHAVVPPSSGPGQLTTLLESLAMVMPMGVRSLQELARSRRGVIPPGSTLIHIGGTYHPATMNYLLGLRRAGHPVIVFHTGREDPPEYDEFEVRDGREMFLESLDDTSENDFQRPPSKSGEWDTIPVSPASSSSRGSD
jgi:uncharacterized protein (DUF58 family)